MFFTKSVVLPLVATKFVLGAAIKPTTILEAPLANYTVTEVEWNVHINASVPTVAINGTIEEILDRLAELHAEYVATLRKNIMEGSKLLGGKAAAVVQARQTNLVPVSTKYYCNNFDDAIYEDIQAGVSYLFGLYGVPTLGPGPGTCARVSCSWDSAIWWCNDNAETESLNSFFDIAIGAIEIMEHCTSLADGESVTKLVNGQQFFRDGWNVIINAADC